MPLGRTMSKATSEGPPSSKWQEIPPLYKVLTWSHSEAFSQDTSLVRETREEYFKRHSPNFTMEGMHDLSEVFRHMAKTAKLLGSAIYMKSRKYGRGQMSCNKLIMHWRSLPKGLKFLRAVPPSESPKVMRLVGIHDLDIPLPLQWHDPLPLVWEGGPEWGDSHQPPLDSALQAQPGVQQMLQLPINLIRHPLPPWLAELPTLRRGRPQWVSLIQITASRRHAELISPNWESEQSSQGNLASLGLPYWGHPHPLAQPWRRTRWRRCHLPTNNILSPVFLHIWTRQLPTNPESHKTFASSVGLYKVKIKS